MLSHKPETEEPQHRAAAGGTFREYHDQDGRLVLVDDTQIEFVSADAGNGVVRLHFKSGTTQIVRSGPDIRESLPAGSKAHPLKDG